jgi:hypothetical protein
MIPHYLVLEERIRQEQQDLDRTQAAACRHWAKALSIAVDQDAYINSVALNLHSWYSGLERIFELIAVEMDGGTLGGADWHTELLRQMTLSLGKVRPAVLQAQTAQRLDEYRKFRHRIRNIYATNIDPKRLQGLMDELPGLWAQIQVELTAFRAVLEQLSHADEP